MTRRDAGMLLGAFVFGIILAQPLTSVDAHPASNWYLHVWGSGSLPTINFKYSDHLNNQLLRARIEDGVSKWNSVQANTFAFQSLPNDSTMNFSNDCSDYTQEQDVIFYFDDGPSYGGATARCLLANDNIKNFYMNMNKYYDDRWYTGTGNPGANELDAWSTAIHELGHATGFYGHFTDTSSNGTCPAGNYSGWQTMCDGVVNLIPGDDDFGKKFRRTLESHDKHTFDAAY